MLFCIILCYSILFYTIYTILYYIILCYTTLYYIIPYYVNLVTAEPRAAPEPTSRAVTHGSTIVWVSGL